MRKRAIWRAFGADGMRILLVFAALLGRATGQGEAMHAEWIEPDGTRRQLDFHLPAAALADSARRITPPSPDEAQRIGFAAAQAAAQQVPSGVKITVHPIQDGVDARISGPSGVDLNTPLRRVMAAYNEATNRAITDAGFRFIRQGLFEADFPRLAREHGALLAEAAREIAGQLNGLSPRDKVQFLVGFLQSIPYETLNTRGRSPMRTPSGVLADNRGDCDAKSVTLAALLASIAPDLSTVLVYGDNHAFLGVSLPVMPGDIAFTVSGRSYIALEPVGPGWFPTGQISPLSQTILASGRAQIAPLHP
jgi:hypothetical protein